jgi:hypothetical protein
MGEMKNSMSTRIAAAGSLALCLSAAVALPAQAQGGVEPGVRGTCTGASHVRLTADVQRHGILVRARVNGHGAGDRWVFVISDNHSKVKAGSKQANQNGDLRVRALIHNLAGSDLIEFVAVDRRNGETCTAVAVKR